MRSRALLATSTAVALAGGATVAVVRLATASNRDIVRSEPTAPVAVGRIALRTVATGSIRLAPGARIDVGARTSGVVRRLFVTQGALVRRGDVIAALDTREADARLAGAEARLAELTAARDQADSDLRRLAVLAPIGGASRQQLSTARATLAQAIAREDAAAADRELARVQRDYDTIRAPIAGIVASITTHEGETVAASLSAPTFVTLIDLGRLECVALVDETDIGHVQAGNRVEFTVDAYPNRTFTGAVTRIAPDATIISGVVDYEVTVRLDQTHGLLRPQMTAAVTLIGASHEALTVPASAVRQGPDGPYVWLRRGGGPPIRTPTVVGARGTQVAEIAAGLHTGDSVLVGGFPDTPDTP